MLRTSHRRPRRHPSPGPRTVVGGARSSAALAVAALLAAPGAALLAAPAAATAASGLEGACADDEGVTVVVDSTALGGGVEAGCAPEAGVTGTEALLAAGFTEARDPSGFICAVDGLPDPCPTEFTGEYWSYWFAEPGGDAWVTYDEGSDTAITAPGAVEGWRYGDGSAGPDVALPVVAAPGAGEEAEDGGAATAGGAATQDGAAAEETADEEGPGAAVPLLAGLGLLAVLAVAAVVVSRRRSAQPADAAADRPAHDADGARSRTS